MQVPESNLHSLSVWGDTAPTEALRQIAGLCQQVTSINLQVAPDGSSFYPASALAAPLPPTSVPTAPLSPCRLAD